MNLTFLPNLIHSDQMGFVKDRYVGQNIRLFNDLMECMDVMKLFVFIYLFLKSIGFYRVEHYKEKLRAV